MKTATVHGRTVRLGRLPASRSRALLHLGLYLNQAALPPPQHLDWSGKVGRWPMMGNDVYGDCVEAMKGHAVQVISAYGRGSVVVVPDETIVKTYLTETGGVDSGLNIASSLDYWVRHPLGGEKLLAHAAIDYRNHTLACQANQLFGGAYVGVNLPADAIPAVNAHQPWISTKYRPDPEAGHAILLVKTEADGPTFVTWGQLQKASWDWWNKYVEEAHVGLAEGWFSGTSLDPSGIDDASLVADYQALTGQKPPVVIPPAPPAPVVIPPAPPAPAPAPVDQLGCVLTVGGKKWKATGWAQA